MKTSSDLIIMSAEGDDRSIAQNGNDRYYWYSVRDMMASAIYASPEMVLSSDVSTNEQSINIISMI